MINASNQDLLLFLGNVDASSSTARYNLKRGHSLLIFVGGEKEQLMTKPHENKIYLKSRKGFIKLALEFGAHLVPMYCYGENECYHVSNLFEGSHVIELHAHIKLIGVRLWLHKNFKIGLCITWGRFGTPVPLPVELSVQVRESIIIKTFQTFTNFMLDR